MANGFVTVSPAVRHGTGVAPISTNWCLAQRFLLPEGSWELNEIGIWVSADAGYTGWVHVGVFTDDAANLCPGVLVAGTDSGGLFHDTATVVKINYAYSVKPEITGAVGGTYYWLAKGFKDPYLNIDYLAAGGTSLYKYGVVYPGWPTDTEWHTHSNLPSDYGTYAVYESSTGGKVVIGSMLSIG